jgi:cell division protein ZapA
MSTVTVHILDKEYQVACPEEQVDALTKAARFLNGKMAEIRGSGKVVGLDRIAVMAALNIANDYLHGQQSLTHTHDVFGSRIYHLSEKVGSALAQHKQLDL